MSDFQKSLCDELLGKDRNLSLADRLKRKEHYSDETVCKNFLVSQCFKELFPNTAHDEGECNKRHDAFFKRQFEDEDDKKKCKYERIYLADAIDWVERKLADIQSKIKQKKQSLQNQNVSEFEKPKEFTEKIDAYEQKIKELLASSAKLGQEGKLEESEAVAEEAEMQRKKKEEEIKTYSNPVTGAKEQKVCEICAAYQAANETEKRVQMHLEGRIHKGFEILHKEIVRLKERREYVKKVYDEVIRKSRKEKETKSRSKSRQKKRRSQEKSEDRNHKHRHHKEHINSRSRSKDKHKKDKR